jgi:hypothetical protein
MPNFTVSPLQPEQIPAVWPLVRMGRADLSLEEWNAYARKLLEGSGGILGAFAPGSRLQGIATFRPDIDLRFGKALRVDLIVTFELKRDAPVRQVLCDAIDLIAEGFGCKGVVMTMGCRGYADPSSAKAETWRALGLGIEAVLLTKKLTAAELETAA